MNKNILNIEKKQKIIAIVFLIILVALVFGIIISFFTKEQKLLMLFVILSAWAVGLAYISLMHFRTQKNGLNSMKW